MEIDSHAPGVANGLSPGVVPGAGPRIAPPVSLAMAPGGQPILERFFEEIRPLVRERNGNKLAEMLPSRPPFPTIYGEVARELRDRYPKGRDGVLAARCEEFNLAGLGEQGSSWDKFPSCLLDYFRLIRDYDSGDLPDFHNKLTSLTK